MIAVAKTRASEQPAAESAPVVEPGSPVILVHDETGGRQTIAYDEAVIETQKARGWRVATPDDLAAADEPARIGVPDVDDDGREWVTLVHDDVPGGVNRVANNPIALRVAAESGWRVPADGELDAPPAADQLEAAEQTTGGTAAGPDTAAPAPVTDTPDTGTQEG